MVMVMDKLLEPSLTRFLSIRRPKEDGTEPSLKRGLDTYIESEIKKNSPFSLAILLGGGGTFGDRD